VHYSSVPSDRQLARLPGRGPQLRAVGLLYVRAVGVQLVLLGVAGRGLERVAVHLATGPDAYRLPCHRTRFNSIHERLHVVDDVASSFICPHIAQRPNTGCHVMECDLSQEKYDGLDVVDDVASSVYVGPILRGRSSTSESVPA